MKLDEGNQDWIKCIDRGGLTHINKVTFEVFVAIEKELRERLFRERMPPDLTKKTLLGLM